MMRFLLYFVSTLFLSSLISCNGCSSKKRGRKARQEAEETRTKETGSMADKYAKIDKACNRLEVMVDTVSTNNLTEITLMRKEINTLRIEAKDIASDYEAAKLSGDIQKQFIDAGLDYMLISNLSSRVENINTKFIQKFGSN
jgi:hypothetical protein